MTPKEFVTAYWHEAMKSEKATGISAKATLAQAAHESAWGKAAPGNMFFGVKDSDGINGNELLLITTEYSRRADLKFPEIISIKPVVIGGLKMFKYTVRDYFRKYDSPAASFIDHGNFFIRNKRYAKALTVKSDPGRFIDEIAKAGYATDPNYAPLLKAIVKTIEKNL